MFRMSSALGPPAAAHRARRALRAAHWRGASCPRTSGCTLHQEVIGSPGKWIVLPSGYVKIAIENGQL